MKKVIIPIFITLILVTVLSGCNPGKKSETPDGKFRVVATTTMLADMTRTLGGDHIQVEGLMGPGIDPHLYKASAGDVKLMQKADMVVYTGLHLEGKMGEIFENLTDIDKKVVNVSNGIDKSRLLMSEDNAEAYDPHIWFDVSLWKDSAKELAKGLKELDSQHAEEYENNLQSYLKELDGLNDYIVKRISELPEEKRVLITAHDAFNYFGHAYGFQVKGLQGISTASEAGTSDLRNLANFIVKHQIKAVFVESSVPKKNIQALQEAVKAQGFYVEIGGELYSDSLGDEGSGDETYIKTFKSNIDTIVDALK
ncbi:metal ABC transporter solute-binding protein, Zn/Mn family [Clostridium polynesiense]|uniref:metal ABC transporter solute-binding protein, Zn/Mn family n=1 Tax=Clostridium polynesiense TaxID=1325933 RepID=UPI00058E654C|nr:zinc ABC transporter substrate-binding protein [Clostridium polynesiense]